MQEAFPKGVCKHFVHFCHHALAEVYGSQSLPVSSSRWPGLVRSICLPLGQNGKQEWPVTLSSKVGAQLTAEGLSWDRQHLQPTDQIMNGLCRVWNPAAVTDCAIVLQKKL